jgi:hypothetical protein
VAEETPRAQPGRSEAHATTALDHVLRGIQDAVEKAQRLANEQHLQMLQFFAKPKTEGEAADAPYELQTFKFLIDQPQKGPPDENGNVPQALIEVPYVSVVPIQTLRLKELEVGMQLRVTQVNPPSRQGQGGQPQKNQEVEFKVDMAQTPATRKGERDSRMIDIKMKFVGEEAPEGVLRLIERVNESIIEKDPNQPSGPSQTES